VVLPASMCAIIPRFLIFSSGYFFSAIFTLFLEFYENFLLPPCI
jgi:hypothetical protein